MAWIAGVGITRFGRLEGQDTLALMSAASEDALQDADLERRNIDGLICGYSTTLPHLMLSTLFAEHFGLTPRYAHAMQVGGATGFGMAAAAHLAVEGGAANHVLVVAGENRLTGQSRDSTVQTLAQVGHATYEVPLGASIPSYYALVASRYMHEYGMTERDFASLAVLMRKNASRHPKAHLRDLITIDDVLKSKPISTPLKILDCCPLSDGAMAFVVSRERINVHSLKIRGYGQAHTHQHVTAAPKLTETGATWSVSQALGRAGVKLKDIGYAAIYDSFTITLAILLEELGFCARGDAGKRVESGYFNIDGEMPLNTHGGLLSFGHSGCAASLTHLAETHLQMTRRAGDRQIKREPALALLHGDGGVLSSHASLVLERMA